MNSNATDPNDRRDPETLDPTTVFGAFAHSRRQNALQYLTQKPGAVSLGDIAEYLAIEEGEMTQERYERILTGLYHTHVPHLVDAGLVEYNPERNTVTLAVEDCTLRPYLDLARDE